MNERTKLIAEIAGKLEIAYYGSVQPTSSAAMERHAKHVVSMAERIVKEAEALEPKEHDFRDGDASRATETLGTRMFEVGGTYHLNNGTKVTIVRLAHANTPMETAVDDRDTHYYNRQRYGQYSGASSIACNNTALHLRPIW